MEPSTTSERLHAFDNARAIMMWLGIVLHVSLNHLTFPTPIPWKDPQTSVVADLLFLLIHSFRMPAFFLLSGFLTAMLLHKRGTEALVRNRLRRLALPFAVFWPILLVGMGFLAKQFMQDDSLPLQGRKLTIGPMHLWFIYYLLMYVLMAAAVGRFIPQPVRRAWSALISHWWAIPLLALPLGLAGAFAPAGMVHTNQSFMPNAGALLYYGVFFLMGWAAYADRTAFAARVGRYWPGYLAAGAVFFLAFLGLLGQDKITGGMAPYIALANGMTALLWSLGVIGLFVRFLPDQNKLLRYLADSSYWVFLVHMLGTIGFGALLYNAPLGAGAKMVINIVATTAACLLSYHFLVRNTWVGRLLNGKAAPATSGKVAA